MLSWVSIVVIPLLLLPISRRLFGSFIARADHWGLLDRPGGRHIHSRPVAVVGGLAIVLTWLAGITLYALASGSWAQEHFQSLAVTIGCAVTILAVGLADDRYGVTPRFRLISELLISAMTVCFEPGVHDFCNSLSNTVGWASYPLTWIGLVAVINAMNLIDGMDGLAGTVFVSIAAAISFLAAPWSGLPSFQAISIVMLLPGLVIFLRKNWNPARTFMGDHGSLAIGYLLATAALNLHPSGPAHTPMDVAVLALLFSYPVLDMMTCMARRRWAGQPMMTGDRSHMHHRMLRLGLPIKESVTSLLLWQVAMICPVLLAPWLPAAVLPLLLVPSVAVAAERIFLLARIESARLQNLKANSFSILPEPMQAREGEESRMIAEVVVSLRPLLEAVQFEEKGQFANATATLKFFCERRIKGNGFVRVLPDHIMIGVFGGEKLVMSTEDIREEWVDALAQFSKMFKLTYSTWSLPVHVREPGAVENPVEKSAEAVA